MHSCLGGMWRENRDKLLKVLRAVREAARQIPRVYPPSSLGEVLRIWQSLEPGGLESSCGYSTAAYPKEPVRGYVLYDRLPDLRAALEELRARRYAVASIDSSSHSVGGHGYVPFIVHNVGVWVSNYGPGTGFEDNRVFTSVYMEYGEESERIWMKENEARVLRELPGHLEGDRRFVMLDESLNLGYTMTWSGEERRRYAEVIAGYVTSLLDEGVIPIGVFYTRSVDIMRGMVCRGVVSEGEYPFIPDKVIMDRFLPDGARSPLMEVRSKALEEVGLDLSCIYVKLGRFNVLRVEFPSEAEGEVEHIHRVVLLEAVVGDGYPYPLQASHENAVLTYEAREAITEVFSEELGMLDEHYVSRKESSKRWPLA